MGAPANQLRHRDPTKGLRVLFIVDAFDTIGGMQEFVHHLGCRLTELGNTIAIISNDRGSCGNDHLAQMRVKREIDGADFRQIWIKRHKPFHWRHPKRFLRDMFDLRFGELTKFLAAWNPDIVACNTWNWDTFPTVVSSCRAAGVPVCFTLHGYGGPAKIGPSMLRHLLNADAVVANSLETRRLYAGLVPELSKARVILCGVDLEPAMTAKPYAHPRPYIFAAARLELEQKAFITLIEAFAQLTKTNSEIDLVIAGEGPDRCAIEREIADRCLAGRIVLLGAKQQSELWTFYRGAMLVAITGLGLTVMEAMAAAKPCVGVDLKMTADLETHRASDFMIFANGASSVMDAFRRLLDNPGLCAKMGAAARQKSLNFGWRQCAEHYLTLFHSCGH